MVRFLLRNVFRHGVHFRWADRKRPVAALPMEILQGAVLGLDPLGRTCLDLLDDFRERGIL